MAIFHQKDIKLIPSDLDSDVKVMEPDPGSALLVRKVYLAKLKEKISVILSFNVPVTK
jgi:hypothetical protein